MNEKLYLKDIATHLIKDSVKSLFEGEQGNNSLNGSVFQISKKGWEHKKGWHQSFTIDTILSATDKNSVVCFIDNTGDDYRNSKNTSFYFYKERDKGIEELEKKGRRVIPYSEISSFEITDDALREAILSWNEKWINNHIAPFVEEAISEPQEWLKIKNDFEGGKKKSIVVGTFDSSMSW